MSTFDDRFAFLTKIVFWLDAWRALAPEVGKLTKQTFTSFRHACIALQEITIYLTGCCGFDYLLTSFLQTDLLEHHFGLYRMMSGLIITFPFCKFLRQNAGLRFLVS